MNLDNWLLTKRGSNDFAQTSHCSCVRLEISVFLSFCVPARRCVMPRRSSEARAFHQCVGHRPTPATWTASVPSEFDLAAPRQKRDAMHALVQAFQIPDSNARRKQARALATPPLDLVPGNQIVSSFVHIYSDGYGERARPFIRDGVFDSERSAPFPVSEPIRPPQVSRRQCSRDRLRGVRVGEANRPRPAELRNE